MCMIETKMMKIIIKARKLLILSSDVDPDPHSSGSVDPDPHSSGSVDPGPDV